MKENGFKLAKERRYSAQTITDEDYANDIALLAIHPLNNMVVLLVLHSLERAAGGMASMSMHTKQNTCDISTLKGFPLKLGDKFTYLGRNVSSTENDINRWLAKALTAINRQSVIWKSDLTNKIKHSFFQAAVVSILPYGCTTWTLTECVKKKLDGNIDNTIQY